VLVLSCSVQQKVLIFFSWLSLLLIPLIQQRYIVFTSLLPEIVNDGDDIGSIVRNCISFFRKFIFNILSLTLANGNFYKFSILFSHFVNAHE